MSVHHQKIGTHREWRIKSMHFLLPDSHKHNHEALSPIFISIFFLSSLPVQTTTTRTNSNRNDHFTLMSFDLMCSSNMNCEKTKNFFERNWYVKLTVVFMMPVPCVRIELATWRMLIVFKCLLLLERSTKICNIAVTHQIRLNRLSTIASFQVIKWLAGMIVP